jgi:hypothetical protein
VQCKNFASDNDGENALHRLYATDATVIVAKPMSVCRSKGGMGSGAAVTSRLTSRARA